MIQEGAFKAHAIQAASIGKSQQKGTPLVSVLLMLDEGPDSGQQIEWIGWITDTTRQRTAESLELLGYDGDDLSTVMRNQVIAVIEHEEFTKQNGETGKRARVKWLNSPNRGGAKFDALSATESAKVLGELRGLVMARKAASGQASAPKAPGPKF